MQGQFELNVFKPVMAANLLQSAELIGDACVSFDVNCAKGIEANKPRIQEHLNNSLISQYLFKHNTHIVEKTRQRMIIVFVTMTLYRLREG